VILAAIAAFVGATVQSAVGFGFALVLSPAAFAVMDPVEAVLTLSLLATALNILVLFEGGLPRHVDWRRLAPLLAAAVPGLAAGVALLATLSKSALQVGVGLAVIAAAGWQLHRRNKGVRSENRAPLGHATSVGVGFASGVLTTSLGVSGPPLVLWLEAHGVRPAEFRQTLAAAFFVLSLAGGGLVAATEGVGGVDAGVVLPLLAFMAVGYGLGTLVFRRLDTERFYVLVLALVMATGAASLLAGLF
jgi:uncharacterized protein